MTWQLVRVPSAHFVDPYQPEGIEPERPDAVPDYLAWVCNNVECGYEDRRETPGPREGADATVPLVAPR